MLTNFSEEETETLFLFFLRLTCPLLLDVSSVSVELLCGDPGPDLVKEVLLLDTGSCWVSVSTSGSSTAEDASMLDSDSCCSLSDSKSDSKSSGELNRSSICKSIYLPSCTNLLYLGQESSFERLLTYYYISTTHKLIEERR